MREKRKYSHGKFIKVGFSVKGMMIFDHEFYGIVDAENSV